MNNIPQSYKDQIAEIMKDYPDIKLSYSTRMAVCAGRAFYDKREIRLNERLLGDNMHHIMKTFWHELAHIVASDRYGKKAQNHGRYWKAVMREFGQEPETYHHMDVSKYRKKRQYRQVFCGCNWKEVLIQRYNKMQTNEERSGKSGWICNKCSEVIRTRDKMTVNEFIHATKDTKLIMKDEEK